ncbi:uncharacterized protein LOC126618092 [Malus sylvestris]|uniref:uncharacterized protein LOC126618092 n=1 Tax=Malus sylvestris TaxID=3752 RepID=UPI0021ABFE07|nr:uncharacterized protein LOC126618092 [Malus sylvestris]
MAPQQDEVVRVLTNTLETLNCPHMPFYGLPGTGKTTTAHQLFRPELYKSSVLKLNASDDRGINVLINVQDLFDLHNVGSDAVDQHNLAATPTALALSTPTPPSSTAPPPLTPSAPPPATLRITRHQPRLHHIQRHRNRGPAHHVLYRL